MSSTLGEERIIGHKGASPLLGVHDLEYSISKILKSNQPATSTDPSISTATILCQHTCPFVCAAYLQRNPQHLSSSLSKRAAEPGCRIPRCTDWKLRDSLHLILLRLPDNTLFLTAVFPNLRYPSDASPFLSAHHTPSLFP